MKAARARRSLLRFTETINPLYQSAAHHELICAKLEAVERGEIDRLMIFMPPRHGKSELASKMFPAWFIGRNPAKQVITASYASELAASFGRDVRNIIAGQDFAGVFPGVKLSPDSEAKNRFNTNRNGAYVAAGVGAGITGKGAHVALIDDPFKDREEADSEVRRDTVWNWYTSTLFTRLMPGGAIVLVQTRWHEDDLAGRLLEAQGRKEDGGEWDVLDLPALDKDGKALWREWYDEGALARIRDSIGPRDWSALYQQQPQPDEGTYFQREWFKEWDELPALRYYGTSDYAVTDGAGDYTVHRIWGIDKDSNIYRIAGWRGQESADKWIEHQLDLVQKYKPLAWFAEGGPIRRAVEPFLTKRMRERKAFCRLEWLTKIADKATKARAFQARAAMGKVYFEPGADIGEYLMFPAGKHDDDVDTGGLIGMAIDQAHPAILAAVNDRPKRDGYEPRETQDDDAWKVI